MVTTLSTGCDGSRVGMSRPPGDPAPTSASPRVGLGREDSGAALVTYRAMWSDLEEAGVTADADSPVLGDHATGAALRLLKYGLSKDRRDHVVVKGTVILAPRVVSENSIRVAVEDCTDSSHWLVYKSDGTLEDAVPGGHHDTEATMRRFGRDWKVEDLAMGPVGSC
ncbi:hypothetical protein POF50_032625 [Streptomyces sp. SL13]|uniref:Uncharacterized protein n=1 Tax=Streptantibioticus silvisoli TaxID=2705255 RepID=A0AA90K1Q5_9ACTN|nr:hypothetical protein [Streptantibioticus silvisoli]MDI5974036.1 hypothetical protein [Streptantibioticus silvisoli]